MAENREIPSAVIGRVGPERLGALEAELAEKQREVDAYRAQLRLAEERLRRAIDVEGIGVVFYSAEGVVFAANDAFLEMTRYTREDALSQRLVRRQLVPEDDSLPPKGDLLEPVRPREQQYTRKDGTRLWVLVALATLEDGTVLEHCLDISERKAAEQALQQNAALKSFHVQLADSLRPLTDPVQIQELAARLLGMRLRTERAFYANILPDGSGFSIHRDYCHDVPSLAGNHDFRSQPTLLAAYRAGMTVVASGARSTPTLPANELAALRALGISAFIAVPTLRRGQVASLLSVGQSTPRVWSEEEVALVEETGQRTWEAVERAHAELALRDSEEKYRTLFHSMDQGFCTVEAVFEEGWVADYRFIEANSAFARLTGLNVSEGDLASELGEQYERHWFEPLDIVATTDEPIRFVTEARALGRWFDVYAFRFGGKDSRRVGLLFSDISEIKHHERSLEDANATLKEVDRRKDEFLAMLGHELRNPLATIRSASELLKLVTTDDERVIRTSSVLERQATHMARLIDGLLEVSRIARGKIELHREDIDLREVIDEVLDDRTGQIESRGLRLHSTQPSEPLWVVGDRVRLAQIFDNLVGNAIKFTPAPGTISVSAKAADDFAIVRVLDTGVGIHPEFISRMFEPFQQETQEIARSAGGLGLGLALAKSLIDLHGGAIKVESAGSGLGAEFQIRIPLAARRKRLRRRDAVQRPRPRRILVVEDNSDARELLCELLKTQGHEVDSAANGPAALEILGRGGVEVVLCDIGLPAMSGFELAQHIRALPELAKIQLVALTGYGQPEHRRRTQEAGFDAHLTKPVGLRDVNAALIALEAKG